MLARGNAARARSGKSAFKRSRLHLDPNYPSTAYIDSKQGSLHDAEDEDEDPQKDDAVFLSHLGSFEKRIVAWLLSRAPR